MGQNFGRGEFSDTENQNFRTKYRVSSGKDLLFKKTTEFRGEYSANFKILICKNAHQ